jgi:hypothetical protein
MRRQQSQHEKEIKDLRNEVAILRQQIKPSISPNLVYNQMRMASSLEELGNGQRKDGNILRIMDE